jgi:NAD(P)H-dependent FMN reductase
MSSVLVFAGSARRESLNKTLARLAAQQVDAAGGRAQFVDLHDFPMPLYDGDLEAADGPPAAAQALGRMVAAHAGLVIVSPENNASVSSLLKNTLDWLSRLRLDGAAQDPLAGRVAALMAASPGAFGGVRGLYHLRAILNTLDVEVLAPQFLLPRAGQAFDAQGGLTDARARDQLAAVVRRLLQRLGT